MGVPASQAFTVASYVLRQRLARRRRYPLVLMLEPLLRCNLACAGCGKIQYPPHVLKRALTVEQCLAAVEECGAPVVSIPGGEPLLYPHIGELVEELTRRGKYVYLCTNALLLKQKLEENVFTPSKRLNFSVHMDGLREEHDASVCRAGTYDIAVEAIREAVRRGFRVTTNTTLFNTAEPMRVRSFFDAMMDLDVEGMMVSPGYNYENAPDQDSFLERERTRELFAQVLTERKAKLAVQPVAPLPAIPHGQARLRMHALGQPAVHDIRLATPVLPLAGRLRRHLPGADGRDRLGGLWPGERQPPVPGLHGALRLRALGRSRDVRLMAWSAGRRCRDTDRETVNDERARDPARRRKPCSR